MAYKKFFKLNIKIQIFGDFLFLYGVEVDDDIRVIPFSINTLHTLVPRCRKNNNTL